VKLLAVLAAGSLFAATATLAAPTPGQIAPDFRAMDVAGKPVSLADFKGRYVVLEWNNPHCPFVQKHYDSGNMQSLQKRFGPTMSPGLRSTRHRLRTATT